MGKIRNFLLCFIFALLSVICLEILLGYSNHLRIFNNTSAIYATIRSVIAQFDEAPRSRSSPLSKHEITGDLPTLNLSKDQNPFAAYPATVGSYRYHPFFDYSGVHLMGAAPIRLDYFGFRNRNSDTYFNVEDDFVVILTGGSEAAGFAHETTIAEHLERFLAKSQNLNGRRVRVLNLSMNSFVLGNEINAFVHLGYRLRPNVVITHSGWNDMINGARVPGPFQVLGLNYMNPMINWLPRLYDLENKTLNNWNHVVETAISSVVEAYLTNLEKYRAIVESSGAYFIAGIQQYDRRPRSDRLHFTTHNLMEELAKQIDQQPSYFSFLGRSDLGFVDTIHTDSKSAHKIAKAYFDHIEYAIAEKKIPTTAPTRTASAIVVDEPTSSIQPTVTSIKQPISSITNQPPDLLVQVSQFEEIVKLFRSSKGLKLRKSEKGSGASFQSDLSTGEHYAITEPFKLTGSSEIEISIETTRASKSRMMIYLLGQRATAFQQFCARPIKPCLDGHFGNDLSIKKRTVKETSDGRIQAKINFVSAAGNKFFRLRLQLAEQAGGETIYTGSENAGFHLHKLEIKVSNSGKMPIQTEDQ